MKKLIGAALLLLPALLACNAGMGQKIDEQNVPGAVREAFTLRFPKPGKTRWELEDGTDYEAVFEQAGVEWSAKFAADGTWLETEHGTRIEDLPQAVQLAVAAHYAGHTIKEAELTETPGSSAYELELKQGTHTIEVLFAADGAIVQSKAEQTESDNTDDE